MAMGRVRDINLITEEFSKKSFSLNEFGHVHECPTSVVFNHKYIILSCG